MLNTCNAKQFVDANVYTVQVPNCRVKFTHPWFIWDFSVLSKVEYELIDVSLSNKHAVLKSNSINIGNIQLLIYYKLQYKLRAFMIIMLVCSVI